MAKPGEKDALLFEVQLWTSNWPYLILHHVATIKFNLSTCTNFNKSKKAMIFNYLSTVHYWPAYPPRLLASLYCFTIGWLAENQHAQQRK